MKKYFLLLSTSLFLSVQISAQLKAVVYFDGDQKLNGFSIAPKKGIKSKSGILILPAWKGVDSHSKKSAEKLSELGYYAFVADIYGEGNYPKTDREAATKAGYYKKNNEDYQKRIGLALAELIKAGASADNIVVIGYCFGGTGAIEAARSGMNIKGIVSFHGGLGRDQKRSISPINTKVLILHGADDFFVPNDEIAYFQKEMRDTKADWQMIYYANAVHAFTDPMAGNDNSKGAAYNEKADKRSWEHLKLFLNEVLKK